MSPHLYILSYIAVYLPCQQLHSDFRDFCSGVFYLMKIIMAELLGHEPDDGYNSWKYTQFENVPDVELLTQHFA